MIFARHLQWWAINNPLLFHVGRKNFQAISAAVDVIPLFLESTAELHVDEADLEISSLSRHAGGSSGHEMGPAVAIRHIPTGIVVQCSGQPAPSLPLTFPLVVYLRWFIVDLIIDCSRFYFLIRMWIIIMISTTRFTHLLECPTGFDRNLMNWAGKGKNTCIKRKKKEREKNGESDSAHIRSTRRWEEPLCEPDEGSQSSESEAPGDLQGATGSGEPQWDQEARGSEEVLAPPPEAGPRREDGRAAAGPQLHLGRQHRAAHQSPHLPQAREVPGVLKASQPSSGPLVLGSYFRKKLRFCFNPVLTRWRSSCHQRALVRFGQRRSAATRQLLASPSVLYLARWVLGFCLIQFLSHQQRTHHHGSRRALMQNGQPQVLHTCQLPSAVITLWVNSVCVFVSEREREMSSPGSWRNNADTHKMGPEEVKKYGMEGSKRPPGQNPGGVLHQRRNLPYSPAAMAAAGLLVVGTIGYLTLYAKAKPGTTPSEVAKVAAGVSDDDAPRQPNK